MLPMTGLRLQSPLRTISVLLVHFLLAHFCRGQSQLIGSPQPIVATVGDDIILPCHLEPAVDVTAKTLEWTRPDLNPRFVYVWRAGQDLVNVKNPGYKGRTSLFAGEVKHGNISLKLSKVKPSDEGRYRCYIPDLTIDSFIELVVGAVSPPVIALSGIERNKGGLDLQCESKGWYPEPEVVWLDGEGNLLSAGPTETVRGPDDLYTVSSRVTVEKRHSNNFTCRVQQKKTHQTRETHIFISDDFFEVQSSSFTLTVGLAVSLAVCILLILLLVFFVWKWRQNIIINKRSHWGDSDKGEERNCSKRNKTEDQRETLMADGTVQMEVLNEGKGKKKNKHKQKTEQQLKEEQQRREEAENKVKRVLTLFSEELETRKNEVKLKQSELQQLREEKQKIQNNLQTVKKDLENKHKELETIQATLSRWSLRGRKEEEQKKNKAEQEVETLKKKMETHQKELDTKIKQVEDKQAEVQQLQDDIQRMMETNLRTLMENLESNNKELKRRQAAPVRSSSSGFQWPLVSRQRFQDEQQRREEAEKKIQILEEKLQEEQQRRKEAEEQIQTKEKELKEKTDELEDNAKTVNTQWKKTNDELTETKDQLKRKNEEISQLKREVVQLLSDEKKRAERAERDLKELMAKNTEWENKFKEEKRKREEAEKKENAKKEPESKLWAPGYGTHYPPTDLLWRDLKSWRSGDKLQVALISNTEEIHHNSYYIIPGR
uniref:Ig-like domain-containing protein n=1 Tax=Dicentrarchus labrax TaxID=13489 RepID=A0A8C4EVC4_DICLA